MVYFFTAGIFKSLQPQMQSFCSNWNISALYNIYICKQQGTPESINIWMHALQQPADDYGLQRRKSAKFTYVGIIQLLQLWILTNTPVSSHNNAVNYREEEEERSSMLTAQRSWRGDVINGIVMEERRPLERWGVGHSVSGNQGNNVERRYLRDAFVYNKGDVDQRATSVLCLLQMAVTAQLPVCVHVCECMCVLS